jgi:prepilin-type N-terminal cleavage/methylation domain-containing protein
MKSRGQPANCRKTGAFTLLELMVVVAIIGLVAAMSVPSILQMRRQAPMNKAIDDIMEMCDRARAGAVLHSTRTQIIFQPRSGKVDLESGDSNTALTRRIGTTPVMSTQFDPSVNVQALLINLNDYTESASAPVTFYDNGTSDEMTLVLTCGGQRRIITLELTTAQPTVQSQD